MEPSKNTERVTGLLDDVRERPERDAEGTDPVYCRSERAFGTRTNSRNPSFSILVKALPSPRKCRSKGSPESAM